MECEFVICSQTVQLKLEKHWTGKVAPPGVGIHGIDTGTLTRGAETLMQMVGCVGTYVTIV